MTNTRCRKTGAAMFRNFTIALMAFLALVDLFATPAILPTLARHYPVSPAAMGLALNASTIGMAGRWPWRRDAGPLS